MRLAFNSERDGRYDYLYKPEELKPIAKPVEDMAHEVEKEPSRREKRKILAAAKIHYKGQDGRECHRIETAPEN